MIEIEQKWIERFYFDPVMAAHVIMGTRLSALHFKESNNSSHVQPSARLKRSRTPNVGLTVPASSF